MDENFCAGKKLDVGENLLLSGVGGDLNGLYVPKQWGEVEYYGRSDSERPGFIYKLANEGTLVIGQVDDSQSVVNGQWSATAMYSGEGQITDPANIVWKAVGNTSVSEAPEGIPAPGVQLRLVSDAYKATQAALLRGVGSAISG